MSSACAFIFDKTEIMSFGKKSYFVVRNSFESELV